MPGKRARKTSPDDGGGGPFYEDFRKGEQIAHPRGRTLTETDNVWFTLITCNTNQIHYNKDYAERNFSGPPFNGRLVVNFALVFSIVLGLSVEETSRNGIMLGLTNLNWSIPPSPATRSTRGARSWKQESRRRTRRWGS
jgi:acyl dehydratase